MVRERRKERIERYKTLFFFAPHLQKNAGKYVNQSVFEQSIGQEIVKPSRKASDIFNIKKNDSQEEKEGQGRECTSKREC